MILNHTVYEGGPGTPLVVAHGLFGSARNWHTLAGRFAGQRPVIAVDMRNHGGSDWSDTHDYPSMARDLADTIARTVPGGQAVLLGHSMGGKAAMALALTDPSPLAGLIVADMAPVGYSHSHGHFIGAMQALDLSMVTRRSQADKALSATIAEPGIRAFLLQNLEIGAGGTRWRINLDTLDASMPVLTGWPDTFGTLKYESPALFIHGGASEYVDANAIPAISAAFPQAEIVPLPGAGHWLHAEQPDAFAATVTGWLDRQGL